MMRRLLAVIIVAFSVLLLNFTSSFSTEFSGAYINYPDPVIRQIDSLFEKGKFSEAKEIIERILAKPENYKPEEVAFAYLRLGLLYKYDANFDEAIRHYQKAIEISPDLKITNDAKTHLATVYFYLGRLDDAERLLREVLKNTKDERQIKFCNYWLRYIRKIKEYQSSFGPLSFSCGKGSLLAVVEKLNLPIRWEEIVKLSVSNKGISLAELKNFLERKGVKVKIVKAKLEELAKTSKPKIVLVKGKHYVVLLGKKGADVAYLDPAKGKKVLVENIKIFKKKFTGYALVFDEGNYKEVSPKLAKKLFGAYCWCCPPGELGGPDDNPNTEYESTDCGSSMGLPSILTNMATLNLVISDVDFRYRHYGIEFLLKRTYNADSPHVSIFGKGWSWYYGARLRKTPSGNVDYYTPTGRIVHFYYNESTGDFIPEYGFADRLWKEGDRYILYRKLDRLYWVFDDIGRLIEVRDRNGNYIRFEYQDDSVPFKPIKIVDSAGREILVEYNNLGYVSKIKTFDGITITYEYDERGHLIRNVDAYGTTVEYVYDRYGYLVELRLPNGTYKFHYYTTWEGYALTAIELPNGKVKRYGTWRSHYNTRVDYPDGTWVSYWNVYPGWTEEVFNAKGRIVLYGYNADGFRNVIVDARGNRVELSYDDRGNITRIQYADGTYEEFSYNEYDLPTRYRDRNGNEYQFNYDDRGNLVEIIYPDGLKTKFVYNDTGLPVKVINRGNKKVTLKYDEYGYPSEITLPSKRRWRFEYDIRGNLVKVTDAEGNAYEYTYDNLRRVIQVKDPQGNIYSLEYNHRNLVRYVDPLGGETTYFYDPLDLLTKVCKGENCYSYERNEAGRIVALIDYNGSRWEILRDIAGYPAGIKDPLGNVIRKEFDNNYRLLSVTLPRGEKITYTYDSTGRLVRVSYPDGNYEEFSYDGNGNVLEATNKNTTISIVYDILNRPVKLRDETLNLEVSYKYTREGWLKEIEYPGKFKVKYKYDKDGNVRKIKFKKGKIKYKYSKRGLLKEAKVGKVKLKYTYDERGLLTDVEIRGSKFGESYFEYKRDALGRVWGQKYVGPFEEIGFIEPFAFKNAQYDKASQLISFETTMGTENFEYDQLGNLIAWDGNCGRREYRYGYDNKLESVKIGEKEVKFYYTALGYRWKKEVGDKVYEYLYGVDGNLLYERIIYDGNIKEERYYIYIPGSLDRPVAMVVKKGKKYEVYYYIHNHQGSVVAVVDRKGRVVNVYDYWSDGNFRYIEEQIEQPFLYTGAYYDRETELYYLRARYYSPKLRRFIQRDPILFEGGINLYNYTGCNFVNYGDWQGKLPLPVTLVVVGAVVYKGYKFAKFTYKCYLCLSKLNSPEMVECKEKYSDPERCLNRNVASVSYEVLKHCYPKECDEGCMELLKWVYQASWKGGRF
ncbi:RHS repeat-associated core domain-containing protein [Phorcysia thermohydrogeniphila]|uniref:RHS repeat-associated protein n=1 Tax=Phorcysia thermohydrogeniphila TaxID=936138 RepID=A0A4R1GEM2_9BACT|nr:RHS repeat-associated core domain-containing protein [Phorcysia thermohydrogeniphila]TCK05303.1 RHS repeat-associated protein [Phorcysia thermohydrogeniphila]